MNLFDLSGEIAVVGGGTGSLGGAIAQGLGEAGANIVLLGRNRERGEARAAKMSAKSAKAIFIQIDATSRQSLETAATAIESQAGRPSILVNAAGGNDPQATVSEGNQFENISLEAWQKNVELNLSGGVLLPCQVFGAAMAAAGRGSIINIASVSAHVPLSRVVAYSAAKAAVLSVTQFLAREWAQTGVRVNSITPGFFPAKQNKKLLFHSDGTPTERAKLILRHTPMGRFGEAEELVGAALFLASPRAGSFVTGADIRVDGGFLSQTI